MKGWVFVLMGAAALTAAGVAILPRGMAAAELLIGSRDDAAVASYLLSSKTPADYHAAAEQALLQKDEDLAASIAALAEERAVPLARDVRTRIATAGEEASARVGADAWNGFVSGDAPNEAALAGALAADLSGAGDLRDLAVQGWRYMHGQEVDPLLTGLAATGLGITAVTVASAGLALPARAGLSTLKVAKRAGKLSPQLAREVGVIASSGLRESGLKATAASFERLGKDIATVGRNAGYRATMDALGTAKSAAEVGTIARLSARFGKATRAVLVLGGTAFTFASLAASAAYWTLSAILWMSIALLWLARIGHRIGRWIWPRRIRLQPAGAGLALRCLASQPIITSASATIGRTA